MSTPHSGDRLQLRVADMVILETQVENLLSQTLSEVREHVQAEEAVGRFQSMVRDQLKALRARLDAIGGREHDLGGIDAPAVLVRASTGGSPDEGAQSVSSALHAIHTTFNHAAFGYGMLHATAHRFFDAETGDLAEAHLRGYTGAAQEVNQLIADVVVWELTREGLDCRCSCPSCDLGVCVCAPHGTATLVQAWQETAPAAAEGGITVRPPRTDSAAANSGLREGDVIVAVDGQAIQSVPQLQAAIREHEPGHEMKIQTRRGQGDPLEITVRRPG